MIPGYVREVEYLESFDRARPRGYRLVVVDELARSTGGLDWRLAVPGRRCRFILRDRLSCKAPAVVELNRSRSDKRENWWGYCPLHLYGRVWDAEHQRLLAAVLVAEGEQP